MESQIFVHKLSTIASQIVILLNLSFNTTGDEKGCMDELLYEKATSLRELLTDSTELTKSTKALHPLYTPSNDGSLILGERIQLARENFGLSEADLARQLNTYSDHISDWECGITEPPASMIIPLANALKCDPLWLLTGNNPKVAA